MDLPVSKGFTKLCTYIISNFEHTVLSYTTTDSEFYRRRLQGSTVDMYRLLWPSPVGAIEYINKEVNVKEFVWDYL